MLLVFAPTNEKRNDRSLQDNICNHCAQNKRVLIVNTVNLPLEPRRK